MSTVVYVSVRIRGRAHEVKCAAYTDEHGRERWACDVDSLTGALEDAADAELQEAKYDAGQHSSEVSP